MTVWKKIRTYYWLSEAFIKRHYKTVFRTTVIVSVIVGLSIVILQFAPTLHSINRIGRVGKYDVFNLPTDILDKISIGLVSLNEQGQPIPGLASSWDISTDEKTYRFQLDTTKTWHDHTPITPEDINYNFKEVTKSVEGNTLVLTLQDKFSPFLTTLTRPLLKDNRFGVGDYEIISQTPKVGTLQTLKIQNSTNTQIYKFYPTENAAITAFKLGEIDTLEGLNFVPETLRLDPRLIITPILNSSRLAVIFFNNNDSLLGSKSTRQALAYAISNKTFGHDRALSPISDTSWAYNQNVKEYAYDAAKAKSMFSTDVKNPGAVKLELKTTLQYLDIAEKIAASWEYTLGIKVDVKIITAITTDYQILLIDYAPPLDPDQYSIWHSTQSTNLTHYANLKVDKILEDGRRTLNPDLRTEIYRDFQRFLLEDCPAVFLFKTQSYTLSRRPIF